MYKVLFHIELDAIEPLKVAIGNINNLLKEIPKSQCDIVVVANYKGPLLFVKNMFDQEIYTDIKKLHEIGVVFLMCNNSLNNLNLRKEDLIEEVGITKAGILEIIKRQAEGYAYVRT
ncbi:DsrE family protein [Desulfurella sp.]|uniref:DsrE family protein n=1 Tax=Desulfurella sp. TaxID=1962857 RepID=UPI003D0DD2AC